MHYNSAGDWLKRIECIQNKALIISVFVPSELATCSEIHRQLSLRLQHCFWGPSTSAIISRQGCFTNVSLGGLTCSLDLAADAQPCDWLAIRHHYFCAMHLLYS
jgi:hypothetical protein